MLKHRRGHPGRTEIRYKHVQPNTYGRHFFFIRRIHHLKSLGKRLDLLASSCIICPNIYIYTCIQYIVRNLIPVDGEEKRRTVEVYCPLLGRVLASRSSSWNAQLLHRLFLLHLNCTSHCTMPLLVLPEDANRSKI